MTDVTWWGHSFVTVDLPGATVVTDPIMTRRLFHLRRRSPAPPRAATRADVVLISHLHHDHLHVPSLRRFDPDVPLVVPRGAVAAVRALRARNTIEVSPGDRIEVAGVEIEVLEADHHDRRLKAPGSPAAPPIGFRFTSGGGSVWYPGDTAMMDFSTVAAVDLALIPIGGWGPSLAEGHIDPPQAASAVQQVGARWTLPIHYGTFWPVGFRPDTAAHRHWFQSPGLRFLQAADEIELDSTIVTPGFGEPVDLG